MPAGTFYSGDMFAVSLIFVHLHQWFLTIPSSDGDQSPKVAYDTCIYF